FDLPLVAALKVAGASFGQWEISIIWGLGVIAHEVGHHVQKLLGIEPKVRHQQQHATQAEANRLSVKMESGTRISTLLIVYPLINRRSA
ncbi:neutral zinc metallopeptidase, partial [Klebsiella pneumoniae]|uniref:neutral zinc metallopeptidase n=1 Tax=Klebsiella pneumoniae TaxID=573 RepID=UPI00272FC50F